VAGVVVMAALIAVVAFSAGLVAYRLLFSRRRRRKSSRVAIVTLTIGPGEKKQGGESSGETQ